MPNDESQTRRKVAAAEEDARKLAMRANSVGVAFESGSTGGSAIGGTGQYPDEYYVSRPPEGEDDLQCVYYRVISRGALVQCWPESDEKWHLVSVYDAWMEDRGGFGLDLVDERDTPWSSKEQEDDDGN